MQHSFKRWILVCILFVCSACAPNNVSNDLPSYKDSRFQVIEKGSPYTISIDGESPRSFGHEIFLDINTGCKYVFMHENQGFPSAVGGFSPLLTEEGVPDCSDHTDI